MSKTIISQKHVRMIDEDGSLWGILENGQEIESVISSLTNEELRALIKRIEITLESKARN